MVHALNRTFHIIIYVSISALPSPTCTGAKVETVAVLAQKLPGCLALHKEHGASASIRVHMDECRIF